MGWKFLLFSPVNIKFENKFVFLLWSIDREMEERPRTRKDDALAPSENAKFLSASSTIYQKKINPNKFQIKQNNNKNFETHNKSHTKIVPFQFPHDYYYSFQVHIKRQPPQSFIV